MLHASVLEILHSHSTDDLIMRQRQQRQQAMRMLLHLQLITGQGMAGPGRCAVHGFSPSRGVDRAVPA